MARLTEQEQRYNIYLGRHLPIYASCGNGSCYLSEQNAKSILTDALRKARGMAGSSTTTDNARKHFQRQIATLEAILDSYWPQKYGLLRNG
jgi:hypothetical protein